MRPVQFYIRVPADLSDECFRGPAEFSLGFMKPSESVPFGHPGAFGTPGAGGSMGYADPAVAIGYGYVTNRMGMDCRSPGGQAGRGRAMTPARRSRSATTVTSAFSSKANSPPPGGRAADGG